MNSPNLFIVGMPRSGTTSLYSYLKQHPEVYLSILKEPHFFSPDLTYVPVFTNEEKEYRSLFSGVCKEKIIGEASVWYLTSKVSAEKIKTYSANAKIIIMLRNPADMLFSLYNLYLRTGNEDCLSFEDAWNKSHLRKNGTSLPDNVYFPEGLVYNDIGFYYDKIKRYQKIFGKKNIKIVVFEKFINDTNNEMNAIMNFLEINSKVLLEYDLDKVNRIIAHKCMIQLRNSTAEIRQKVKQKNGKIHLGTKRQIFLKATRLKILDYFKQDILKTSRLIDIDLGLWLK